uniref:Glutaminase EF-hand domain-containing protein n=1 Tax=Naja naja TaxID=35670 RepID=A0A8C6V5H9_NAJNA
MICCSHFSLSRDLSVNGMLPRLSDLLFYTIAEGQERISVHKFTTALQRTGLWTSDPRLRDCMNLMRTATHGASSGGMLSRELFRSLSASAGKFSFRSSCCTQILFSRQSHPKSQISLCTPILTYLLCISSYIFFPQPTTIFHSLKT